jgi:hypothetical protein
MVGYQMLTKGALVRLLDMLEISSIGWASMIGNTN